MFEYPVELTSAEEGGFIVTFPDVPEAITQAEDEVEALQRARDALESALSFYVDGYRPLPQSSPANGRPMVTPEALTCAKLALHQVMVVRGVRKSELARRLNCSMTQIDRLLDLNHASPFEQIETALAILGKRLVVELREAA